MSDVKDVKEELNQRAVITEDNLHLDEINRGYRILYFDDKNFISRQFKINAVRIYDKSVLSISKYGDELFTRTRNKLMKDENVLTYPEQMECLKKRGLWNDEREAELSSLRARAEELTEERNKKLSKVQTSEGENVKKASKEADEMMKLYQEIYDKFTTLVSLNYFYFKDTLELQSQVAQQKGWVVSSVCRHLDNDGKPLPDEYNPNNRLWKDIDDFHKSTKDHDAQAILSECINFWDFNTAGGEAFFVESPEDLISDSAGDTLKS